MSEPEDLILEGAHFATRVARDVWARYGSPAALAPPPVGERAYAARAVRHRALSAVNPDRAHGAAGAAHLAVTACNEDAS